MALITDLPAATSLSGTDVLILDTGSTTKKITVTNTGFMSTSDFALTKIVTKDIAANGSVTFTITSGSRGFLVISAAYLAERGLYIVAADNANTYKTDVVAPTGLTLTLSQGSMTVASTHASTASLILFKGSAS